MYTTYTTRLAVGLLIGVTAVGACDDRSTPTASSAGPAPAFDVTAGLTSVVADPVGDAHWNLNSGPGSAKKVPAYLDIARAEVAKQGKTFVFTMDVADIVPSNPTEAAGGAEAAQVWIWGLDTDPTTFPEGGTFPPNSSNLYEFFVDVEWDGARFTGLLFDRRPLLTGGAVVLTPVQFTIDGARITVSIAASALSDRASFAWNAATLTRHSYGTEGFQIVDLAPDAGLAAWPQ